MPKTMAAVIHEKGEPDVFRWEEIELGAPGPGEVCLKNNAVGVNFVDTYHRRGTPHPWPVPPLPLVLGFEGAAEVQETGPGGERIQARGPGRLCHAAAWRVFPGTKLSGRHAVPDPRRHRRRNHRIFNAERAYSAISAAADLSRSTW